MNQTFFDLVSTIINKIGYTMDQAWPMMVKYTWAKGVAGLTICVLFFLAYLFVCFQTYRGVKTNGWMEKYIFASAVLLLASIPCRFI